MKTDQGILFDAIRRSWWLPLLAIAVALGVAAWITAREEPQFSAEAFLVVAPDRDIEDPGDVIDSLDTLERRTILATLAKYPGRAETKRTAGARLGWDASTLRRYWIGGSVVPQTNLIRIEVRGPDAEGVAELATAAAHAARRDADRVYPVYSLRLVEEAEAPRQPIRPQPRRTLVVAGILGLFSGLAAALAFELLRGRSPGRP